MQRLAESELILNKEGRIYHINAKPGDIADTVITVGDPARVSAVSQYFDEIEFTTEHRELITHTGYLNGQRLSVISTGMGTPNIDIVINELDAIFNIDFETRCVKPELTSLNIIRFGTAGCMQADVPVGSVVLSDYAIGFDNLMWFYPFSATDEETRLRQSLLAHFNGVLPVNPYVIAGAASLKQALAKNCLLGMTATCPGFYGPQNRMLRAPMVMQDFLDRLATWRPAAIGRVLNFEMETSAIYGMASLLGHQACSLSVLLANRQTGEFVADANQVVDSMIQSALEALTSRG